MTSPLCVATGGWCRRVFHYRPPTPMYRNSPPLCTIVLQIPSLMPLKMRKVQLQVPKREARVILVSVPCSERVPPLILRADHQGPQAALRSVVVRGHAGGSHEDKQFLDVPLDSSAQVALGGCRVLGVGTALGQQFPLQLLLDPLPLPCLGMGEALGRRVNVMDCRRPPGQLPVFGVEGSSGRGCPAAGAPSTAASVPGSDDRRHRSR